MIHILKNKVEEKIGTKIENRGDCELLSNAILDVLDIDLSYNTIRRLYGLAPSTKPNSKTLNTLALFIGYNSYVHFVENYNIEDRKTLSQSVFQAVNNFNDDEIIEIINWAEKKNVDISLIEVMPIGSIGEERFDQYKLMSVVEKDLTEKLSLTKSSFRTNGPSRYFTRPNSKQKIGLKKA